MAQTVPAATVVNLTLAHLQRLMEVEQHSFTNPWSQADFLRVLADDRAVSLGLVVAGQLVGFAVGYVDQTEFHLANLAIDPAVRRQGWGRHLLRRILAQARHLGCRWCTLEVRESNQAAQALYRAEGFVQTGRRPRYYRRPSEDGLVLRGAIDRYWRF
ncbi:MAG: ribosomal protein S18-alanine N-acetyltransferase [Candidatus Latescibacterota bacterium]